MNNPIRWVVGGLAVAAVITGLALARAQVDTGPAVSPSDLPLPCSTTLPADTLNGAVGSGAPCAPRVDSARPTVVQAANTTTDASGNFTITWAKSFVSASPIIIPVLVNSTATNPGACNVTTRSATTVTGKCWMSGSVTVSILGAVVNVFNPITSAPVMVIGREPTQ